jgi:hypothetical protein
MKNFDRLFKQMNESQNNIFQSVSPIIDSDVKIYNSFLSKANRNQYQTSINFENSFEYIRMYFNRGRYQGFKCFDDEDLIIFALEKKKKPHFKIFKPLGDNALEKLPNVVATLNSISPSSIQTVCLNNEDLKSIKRIKELDIKNIKEFNYWIYDLDKLNSLRGIKWKNVRQKISAFQKDNPKLKIEPLGKSNYKDVIHFIGAWRRTLLSNRGLSYANLEKNKFAAHYYADKNDFTNIWSTVYRLSGRVVAVQLLYRLGTNSAAHAIGLADTSIPGLSETTQINIWEQLHKQGIRYINDGPSWRTGLDRYKRKFNPVSAQQVFECKLKSI